MKVKIRKSPRHLTRAQAAVIDETFQRFYAAGKASPESAPVEHTLDWVTRWNDFDEAYEAYLLTEESKRV